MSAGRHMSADILASELGAAGVQRRLVQSTEIGPGDNAEVLGGEGEVFLLVNDWIDPALDQASRVCWKYHRCINPLPSLPPSWGKEIY